MSINTYFLSKSREGNFGSVFYLKQLQQADASGGGLNLLGSMVQWIEKGVLGTSWGGTDYPIPQCMSQPRALIKELQSQKAKLEIDGDVTLQIQVAGSSETVKIEKKTVFDLGIGQFPLIPLNAGLDVDYSKLKTITLVFGEGTHSEYIPIDYMARLHRELKGKPNARIGGKLLEKNAYISQVVLAKNYSVNFESTENFSVGVESKLEQYNALPEIGGKVKIEKKTNRTLIAEVKSDKYYAVAVTASHWKNLKLY